MTGDGQRVFAWDDENRLIAAEVKEGLGQPRLRSEYTYDAQSRRVRAVDYIWSVTSAAFEITNTRHFVYEGWNLITEMGTGYTNFMVCGLDLSGTIQGAGGIGGVLAVDQFSISNLQPLVYFPIYDGNGNVADLVDATGAVVGHYDYDPLGNTIAMSGSMAPKNPFRFSTKYFEAQWNLYNYGYRYYAPTMGRFISRDPFDEMLDTSSAESSDENLYWFGENDPVDEIDTLGLYTFQELPSEDLPVAYLLAARGGLGYTIGKPSIEKPLNIKFADCCCSVEQPESYKLTVQIILPLLRSRAREAWVVGSTRSGVKRHEKKHVKILKHYGNIWQLFENWQTQQSISGDNEAECQAKLQTHIDSCRGKARDFFYTKTKATSDALDAVERWDIVQGWVPAWWYPDGEWPMYRQARIFQATGNWSGPFDPVKLDCPGKQCPK